MPVKQISINGPAPDHRDDEDDDEGWGDLSEPDEDDDADA